MTSTDWLPPPGGRRPTTLSVWRPSSLRRVRHLEEFSYVCVEEMEGNALGLSVTDWPRVDEAGRLRFLGPVRTVGGEAVSLQAFLRSHRRPRQLADRPLRTGDTFALRVVQGALAKSGEPERHALVQPVRQPDEWMRPPIYDVTADAREAAKASFYASVTPTLDAAQTERLRHLIDEPPRTRLLPGLSHWLQTPAAIVAASGVLVLAGIGGGTALGRSSSTETLTEPGVTTVMTVTETAQTVTTTGQGTTTKTVTTTTVRTVPGPGGRTITTRSIATTTQTVPRDVTIEVTLDGFGTGRVSSDPPGLNCVKDDPETPTNCEGSFPAEQEVTLTAEPTGETSGFRGWTGTACPSKATVTCTFQTGMVTAFTGTFFTQAGRR